MSSFCNESKARIDGSCCRAATRSVAQCRLCWAKAQVSDTALQPCPSCKRASRPLPENRAFPLGRSSHRHNEPSCRARAVLWSTERSLDCSSANPEAGRSLQKHKRRVQEVRSRGESSVYRHSAASQQLSGLQVVLWSCISVPSVPSVPTVPAIGSGTNRSSPNLRRAAMPDSQACCVRKASGGACRCHPLAVTGCFV